MDTDKMMETIQEKVQRFSDIIGNQKHMSALRDGFATFIPFIIAGSFALLFSSVLIDSNGLIATWVGVSDDGVWAKFAFYVSPVFKSITDATMMFLSVYIAFLFGYFLAGAYGDNKIIGASIGLACFLVLQPIAAGSTDYSPTYYFGSTGIIFAMIGGLTGPTIFHHLASNGKFSITMPDKVPPAIADSFKALLPLIFTILIFALIQPIWGGFSYAIGLGATVTERDFYTLSGTINYNIVEGDTVTPFTISGTIEIYEGSGLYTLINLFYISGIYDYLISNPDKGLDIISVMPPEYIETINNWINGQVISILGKGELWTDPSIIWNNPSEFPIVVGIDSDILKTIDSQWYYIINVLYIIFVLPLQNASVTAPFIFVALFGMAFFWFFGIHGPSVMSTILTPLWGVGSMHNVEVLASFDGDLQLALESGLLVTFNYQTSDSFCLIGGTGATLGLTAAILVFSKSPQHQEIGKISATPQLFQVNEPILFGLPIIINPIYAIPYMLVMPVAGVFIYYITLVGWINPTTIIVPWTTPFFISGFVTTQDWRFFIWMPIILIWMFLCYLPFVLFDVRQQVKEELNSSKNNEYKSIKLKIEKLVEEIDNEKYDDNEINTSNLDKKDSSGNNDQNKKTKKTNFTEKSKIKIDNLENKLSELILKRKNIEKKVSELMFIQIHIREGSKNFNEAKKLIERKYELKLLKTINKKNGTKFNELEEIKKIDKELNFLVKEQKILNKIDNKKTLLENQIGSKEDKIERKTKAFNNKIDVLNKKNKKNKENKILNKTKKVEKLKNSLENYKITKTKKSKLKEEQLIKKTNEIINKKENYLLNNK